MQYPNLRYGNPVEFKAYVLGVPIKDVARRLRRSEKTIKNYIDGSEKIPWWIPELMRLQAMERMERMRQMNMIPKLRLVKKVSEKKGNHSMDERNIKNLCG